jgi:hypothetical protein
VQRRHVTVAVSLVLVLAGVGVLLTLVSRVREASARMMCLSNLKGHACALHEYANANGSFPAGTVAHPTLPPEQRLSWCVSVLPHMEANETFKQFDLTRGPGDSVNAKPASKRLRWFVCPSSGEYDHRTEHWKSPSPLTHYVGVAGVGPDAAELPLEHPRAGVFGHDRSTRFGYIGDGISNTLLLIETANAPGHWAFGGFATVRAFDPADVPYLGPGCPFGGLHGSTLPIRSWGVCTVAMADGSVRKMITYDTAPEVLEALATVGGKESLPEKW